MLCSKCGKEIKEENKFCTNCGHPIKKVKINNSFEKEINLKKQEIKTENINLVISKKTITIIAFALLIFIICILIILLLKKDTTQNTSIEDNIENINNIETTKQQEVSKIEIGATYRADEINYIKFDTETEFTMENGDPMSEKSIMNGTYTINENKINLLITYDSYYDYIDEPNQSPMEPYTLEFEILDNGTLKYNNMIYDKNASDNTKINDTSTTSVSLLDEIYAKYPEYKNKEGYICTDGTNYWLLDINGGKLYFNDITTFEYALKAVENSFNSGVEFNLNKFITELSYSSLSTVHDSNYGGDGYRSDFNFYNEELTLSDFNATEDENFKIYTLNTNGTSSHNYPFLLEIKLSKQNKLKEINIQVTHEDVSGILLCAEEIEDALGYTLINSRNYSIVDKIKKNLISQGAITDKGKILKNEIYTQAYDDKVQKTSSVSVSNTNITYKMKF